jgi:hypothetical protein
MRMQPDEKPSDAQKFVGYPRNTNWLMLLVLEVILDIRDKV